MMNKNIPTYEKQADILVKAGMRSSAGLSAECLRREIAGRLEFINFHRFEAYWKNHVDSRQGGSQLLFYPGTYWEDILKRYMFDRMLRHVASDSVARIEVALRTQVTSARQGGNAGTQLRYNSGGVNLQLPTYENHCAA